jgi:hypothetical protein
MIYQPVAYYFLHKLTTHKKCQTVTSHAAAAAAGCRGGHGRTGTLVAVMLGRLYDLPASGALRLTQAYHDCRIYPQGVRSPQTTVQRAQVCMGVCVCGGGGRVLLGGKRSALAGGGGMYVEGPGLLALQSASHGALRHTQAYHISSGHT